MTQSVQPDPDVVGNRVGDEVVLVQLRTSRIYSLNRTAARLWELLSDGQAPSEIEEQLVREFDVEQGEVAQEVDEVLGRLREAELIRDA